MPVASLNLNLWQNRGIFIESPLNPRELRLPALAIGSIPKISFSIFNGSPSTLIQLDLSTIQTTLAVDSWSSSESGQIIFTVNSNVCTPVDLSSNISTWQTVLQKYIPNVTITQLSNGTTFINAGDTGTYTLSAAYAGDSGSAVNLSQITTNANGAYSEWRVHILKGVLATILPNAWTVNGQSLTGSLNLTSALFYDLQDDKARLTITLNDGTNIDSIVLNLGIRSETGTGNPPLIGMEGQGQNYVLSETATGSKISQMPAAVALTGTEIIPVVQGGNNKSILLSQIVGSGSSVNIAIETPSGTVDGINQTFTTTYTPNNPPIISRNGLVLKSGIGNDYTFSGNTIIFQPADVPQVGSSLQAVYTH